MNFELIRLFVSKRYLKQFLKNTYKRKKESFVRNPISYFDAVVSFK